METNVKKGTITWLSVAHLVCDTYSGFMNPLMPFIALKLGISLGLATIIISISHVCSSMLQPLFGFLADNTLKRIFVFWGLVLISVFVPLTPIAPNIGILILFMILGSLGGSFFHPQGTGFVHKFAQPNSNAMGWFMSFGSIGFSLGPLLAAFVVQYMGMEKLPLTTVLGLVTAGLMFNFLPKLSGGGEVVQKKQFFDTFVKVFENQQIRYLLMISMMKTLVTNSACILLPFLWRDMGCSPFYIGAALFSFIFAGGIASFVSHKVEKLIGTKNLLYISMCATLPLIVGFAITYQSHKVLSLIFFLLMGFVTMLAQPVTVVMAQRLMPEYKSVLAGLMVGFSWGVVAVALSVIGVIAEKVGIINTLVVLFVLPIFATYYVRRLKAF